MGGGAGPAVLPPDETNPADEARDPIDLVSDTSESTDHHSDSDDSSAVVVVEPTDQAAADVPRLADLMATPDFTQYLLNDPHAPMVTVSLEEQALAPARTLARAPYPEHLLAHLPSRKHMLTWPPTWPSSYPARLELLPEALADYRSLGDPNVVTRALLAQINYIVDVAANMPANTHTTASGVFRLAWRGRQKSTTIVVRLRTVNTYLPQTVASCLRSPPAGTQPPTLSPVAFPPAAPSPVDFVHVRWKFEYPLSLPGPFVEWYMSRLRFGPRLMAVCAQCRISAQLLEHAQIPELRAVVQVRVPPQSSHGGLPSSGGLAA